MTEIWFYHLQSQPIERALPVLVEKGLERGWRVAVQTVDDLRIKVIDDLLWTYAADRFLPHGSARDNDAERQPVLVTDGCDNRNQAAFRIFVDGSEIDVAAAAAYERVILLFDGRDDLQLDAARRQWSRLKSEDVSLAYWRQSEAGRWERQS